MSALGILTKLDFEKFVSRLEWEFGALLSGVVVDHSWSIPFCEMISELVNCGLSDPKTDFPSEMKALVMSILDVTSSVSSVSSESSFSSSCADGEQRSSASDPLGRGKRKKI